MNITPYKDRYANLAGPGDARPTAMQIIRDNDLIGKLGSMVALVTGGTSGIGVETVKALHETGADVYFTARNIEKGESALKNFRSASNSSGKLEYIIMELDSLDSVRKAAADFLRRSSKLNILIANAGIMACPEGKNKDGFETQFGTNHLSHFLLFQLLKSTLLWSSTPKFISRVICVSSAAHRANTVQIGDYDLAKQGYTPFGSYGQSKTANIYMANELDRRYGTHGIHAWSLHPGMIDTGLGKYIDESHWEALKADSEVQKWLMSPEQGAATQVWAAVATVLEGLGGKYLSECGYAAPVGSNPTMGDGGYAPHAFDEGAEKRLWKDSLSMVGLGDDE